MRIVPGGGSDLTIAQLTEMERIARTIAAHYKRRVWWSDAEELEQIAWEALLSGVARFDETEGTPFGAWCWIVARNAIGRALMLSSAPVTTHGRVRALAGMYRAQLELPVKGENNGTSQFAMVERPEVSALNAANRPDRRIYTLSVIERVRARLVELIGEESISFALAVFTNEFKPSELAECNGLTVERVYALRQKVRRILREDETMHELWLESRT